MSLSPYALILKIRHFLYDKGIIKTRTAETFTISVGNITVGGTGKTPHTEMLLRMLQDEMRTGVLSRGYKRKGKGFAFVATDSGATRFGDEPVQIKRKFPKTVVAVDKSRLHGIQMIEAMQADRRPQVIILDDAFQYRRLRPSVSILLIDWNRPLNRDRLLPFGRLRDLPSRLSAADIIIVTKCPPYITEQEAADWTEEAGIKDCGKNIYFTSIEYSRPEPVFPEADQRYAYSPRLIMFSGIADDRPMRQYLSEDYEVLMSLRYPDHHRYSRSDIKDISSVSKANPTALVLTTEKDAQRIMERKDIPSELKNKLFYLPIKVNFLFDGQKDRFREQLLASRDTYII
ncbi:MAG: tetraacyldisaccharide 4'-kinase [Muribaculum sp.]|uniref:Tetraacyldisaccharide 4'-kinase n=1 Tax=Candidatus Merdivivens faecigallinarum TaxID=2840871 RepID=A0A9D9NQJ0_9BACT|nr:tetraacyldisaccharide 4'-kinase [Candidatus Merdivivens faecigallinarum]